MLTLEKRTSMRIENLGTGMLGKKHSKETKEKIKMAMKGKKPSKKNRVAVGKSNRTRGCSEETKGKMREAHKGESQGRGWKLSEKTKKKMSTALREKACRGSKHPNWKGGITSIKKQIKHSVEYKQWRNAIYKRDNWTCQNCNQKGVKLNPHHIKAFSIILRENKIKTIKEAVKCKELWEINNGITLCKKCHKLTPNYGNFKLIQEFPKGG